MELRCPTCKKTNREETLCSRCDTDLTVLAAIRSAAECYLKQSRQSLLMAKGENALICAQSAWNLEHTPEAARQAFLSCLLMRRFDQATQWYVRANRGQ